jgi:predicted dehydrogenase
MLDMEAVALYDPDCDRASAIARTFQIPAVHASLEALLEEDMDAVLVACPNYLHGETTIAALQAGFHVLCEKPMANCSTQARAMVEAAEHAGRELMIGFTNRFRPEIAALSRTIHAGHLGELRSIRCEWWRRSGVPGAGTWFTNDRMAGGGALTDLGSHLVDLALWLAGDRKLLTASCIVNQMNDGQGVASWYRPVEKPIQGESNVELGASGFLVMNGPLHILIEAHWDSAVPCDQTSLRVLGSRGLASFEGLFGLSPSGHRPQRPLRMWLDGNPNPEYVAGSSDLLQPYRAQWRYFADSLRSGESLRSSLQDGLRTVEAVEAMYASSRCLSVQRND